MIGVDTNVLVRYIRQDDPKQSPQATKLIGWGLHLRIVNRFINKSTKYVLMR